MGFWHGSIHPSLTGAVVWRKQNSYHNSCFDRVFLSECLVQSSQRKPTSNNSGKDVLMRTMAAEQPEFQFQMHTLRIVAPQHYII